MAAGARCKRDSNIGMTVGSKKDRWSGSWSHCGAGGPECLGLIMISGCGQIRRSASTNQDAGIRACGELKGRCFELHLCHTIIVDGHEKSNAESMVIRALTECSSRAEKAYRHVIVSHSVARDAEDQKIDGSNSSCDSALPVHYHTNFFLETHNVQTRVLCSSR